MINYLRLLVRNKGIKGIFYALMKRLLEPAHILIYKVCCLLPADKYLIVFRTQPDFADNGWALWNYLNTCPDYSAYRFVWLVNNCRHFEGSKNTKFVPYDTIGLCIQAAYYLSRAHYVFFTHYVPPMVNSGRRICVNLCHGCGYKASKSKYAGESSFRYAMVTSSFFIEPQSKFLGCDKKKILPLGFPRNDVLLHNIGNSSLNPIVQNLNFKKVILWMPTFRASYTLKYSENSCDNETGLPVLDNEKAVYEFNEFLEALDVVMILKIHPMQAEKDIFKKKLSHIIFVQDKDLVRRGLQLYQIVGKTDALLTDYSSIAIDYIILDKPMGFVIDDIDNYIKDRGFVFDDVLSLMPGDHIVNQSQLRDFATAVLDNRDPHKDWRHSVLNIMYDKVDDGSCRRIAEFLSF